MGNKMAKQYELNLSDPRVYKRAKRAYGFTRACVTTALPGKEYSKKWIDKHFGDTSRSLGKYLKSLLLIEVDSFYNPELGKTKKWRANDRGMSTLLFELKRAENALQEPSDTFERDIIEELIEENYGDDLRSGDIQYKDRSYRLFHGFQNTKREFKEQLLAKYGYYHHYDIECAAPTIIMQQAQLAGMRDPVLSLLDYTQNKDTIRQTFANELDLPLDVIKKTFVAITNGANLHKQRSVYKLINDDKKFDQLRSDRFIKEYIRDLKMCWKQINPNREQKQWTNTYYRLERQCLEIAKDYCINNNIKYYLEHDGFSTSDPVSTTFIERIILRETNLKLKFSYKRSALLVSISDTPYNNSPERKPERNEITLNGSKQKILNNLTIGENK